MTGEGTTSLASTQPLSRSEIPPHELLAMGPQRLMVRVESIRYQGEDLNEYELVDPGGKELPPFTAGSHIDLYFRDGRIRQYSICNSELERHRYRIVVQRDNSGRGGSKAIFERVHVGRQLVISYPRNNFRLAEADHHLLIAGGIGVTPLLSMVHSLSATGQRFQLHYCTRSPSRTAFLNELQPFVQRGQVVLHHDGGDPKKGLDLITLLASRQDGTHLYYCGPSGFMRVIAAASAHWPEDTVHFEHFSVPAGSEAANEPLSASQGADISDGIPVGFEVRTARTGRSFEVPNDKSILQVLRENGIDVASSCESGLCGTCRTRYLEGVPDHRDYILEDEDKEKFLLVCCSRSKSRTLVLDL